MCKLDGGMARVAAQAAVLQVVGAAMAATAATAVMAAGEEDGFIAIIITEIGDGAPVVAGARAVARGVQVAVRAVDLRVAATVLPAAPLVER
jgi:hypothetical protein